MSAIPSTTELNESESVTVDEPLRDENCDTSLDAPSPEATSTPTDTMGGTEDGALSDLMGEDVTHLRSVFPELQQLEDVSELNNSARYSELRSLGLTPEEAYLATKKREAVYDNRSHLVSAVPAAAHSPRGMSGRELGVARELFSDLSDSEIQKLYQKVTR